MSCLIMAYLIFCNTLSLFLPLLLLPLPKLIQASQSTMPTTQVQECVPGFRCVNGVCSTTDLRCECDHGWEGVFCHQQRHTDNTPSGNNVTTISSAKSTPPTTGLSPIVYSTTPQTDQDQGLFSPLEGHGPLRHISIRNCTPGFECRYGNCTWEGGYACACEPGYVGTFCHQACPRDCGPHGHCKTNPLRCECDPLYTGVNCSTLRPPDESDEKSWTKLVVGMSVAVVVLGILVVLMLVLAYWLWRRGNLTMLSLVFWYRQFEEDDGRLYDAFVSYASSQPDRKFVMEQLLPILEGDMSFTLCIHERDFMPGKYITSNITEAVQQSRRTLLVLTPHFVSRTWCQFEFQTALAEMIEQKHRILPLIVGDLTHIRQECSSEDNTLHRVLNTVTYLQYPGDDATHQESQRFWKRLELSMPKKRRPQTVSPSTSTSICPPSSTPTSSSSTIDTSSTSLHSTSIAHDFSYLPLSITNRPETVKGSSTQLDANSNTNTSKTSTTFDVEYSISLRM